MKAKNIVQGALLTALSIIIPVMFGGTLRILIGPFSATLASHVPVMLAMRINPMVAGFVGVGSSLGFLVQLGPVVAARALMHVPFAVLGAILYQKGMSFTKVLIITLPIHAIAEALIVIPFGFTLADAGFLVGVGTAVHHAIDSLIALSLAGVLSFNPRGKKVKLN
ncbi:MAG TPA: ECF transporter S component [Clostridia bacterium]|nr:ECF transporter S component [Clostridia bacterium]